MNLRSSVRHALVTALGIVAASRGASAQQQPPPDDLITVEVATVGIGMVSRVPVIILHDPRSDKTMPVWIGAAEAEAIARSLFGVKSPRPMTHDLLAELIKAMNGTLEEVLVNNSKGGIYYGRLHIRNKEKELVDLDSRPSDAIAIALRTGAPIRVSRRLLEEAPEIEVRPDSASPDLARALGLTVVSPTDQVRKMFDLPNREGVVVVESVDDAAGAGIHRGDLILSVNGTVPKTAQGFWDAVRKARNGGTIQLRYWRQGEEKEAQMKLKRPAGDPTSAVPA